MWQYIATILITAVVVAVSGLGKRSSFWSRSLRRCRIHHCSHSRGSIRARATQKMLQHHRTVFLVVRASLPLFLVLPFPTHAPLQANRPLTTTGMPLGPKLFLGTLGVLVLALIVLHLTGHGFGHHH